MDIYEVVTEFDEVERNPGLCYRCGKHYDAITCEEAARLQGREMAEHQGIEPSPPRG